jgi:hypothetical protein
MGFNRPRKRVVIGNRQAINSFPAACLYQITWARKAVF